MPKSVSRSKAPRYVSLAAMCARYELTAAVVYKLIHEGVLPPPIKFGDASRWDEDALAAAVARMRRGVDPDRGRPRKARE